MAKALKFNPNYAFSLAETRQFNRICRQLAERSREVSPALAQVVGDYVLAGSRLASLHVVLGSVIRRAGSPAAESTRVLQINRQIDATTALRMRLAEKLGLLCEEDLK